MAPEVKMKRPFRRHRAPGSRVTAYVYLPNCWDGVHLDSSDHMSHVAYPNPSTGCPADHPYIMPGLYIEVSWWLANGTGATLSTGDISTMQVLFYDAWDYNEMSRLVDVCMKNGVWCGAVNHSGENHAPVIQSVVRGRSRELSKIPRPPLSALPPHPCRSPPQGWVRGAGVRWR